MTERRSLEGAFALAPRERTQTTAAVEPPAPVEPADPPAPAPRRLRSAEQPAARPLRELAAISFYVPAQSVAGPWRERARSREQTLAEVLADATQAVTVDQVAGALQQPGWRTTGVGMPTWDAAEQAEASVNVQVRLGSVQLRWLDDQVAAIGAKSRSQFVATLLSLYLR